MAELTSTPTHTLLLQLEGPLQSYGVSDRHKIKGTQPEPSKSAVMGILCAALGMPREGWADPLSLADLCALRFGVRVDRSGTLLRDYQTAGAGTFPDVGSYGAPLADGKRKEHAIIMYKYYLADARFVVGLEGPHALLTRLEGALRQPHWTPCLGRKGCAPAVPLLFGSDARTVDVPSLWSTSLRDALQRVPYHERDLPSHLVLDSDVVTHDLRYDVPLDWVTRRFGPRYVVQESFKAQGLDSLLTEEVTSDEHLRDAGQPG